MKLFITSLVWLCISALQAQTNTAMPDYGNTATLPTPNTLTSRFNADYPNNNPTWTTDGAYYRADFTDITSNTDHYVTYDRDGNVMIRGAHVSSNEYPKTIDDYYTRSHPGETYEVWSREEKPGGSKTYYVNRDYETLWFDSGGRYQSTTKSKTKAKTKTKK